MTASPQALLYKELKGSVGARKFRYVGAALRGKFTAPLTRCGDGPRWR